MDEIRDRRDESRRGLSSYRLAPTRPPAVHARPSSVATSAGTGMMASNGIGFPDVMRCCGVRRRAQRGPRVISGRLPCGSFRPVKPGQRTSSPAPARADSDARDRWLRAIEFRVRARVGMDTRSTEPTALKIEELGTLATVVVASAALAVPALTAQAELRGELRAIHTDMRAGQGRLRQDPAALGVQLAVVEHRTDARGTRFVEAQRRPGARPVVFDSLVPTDPSHDGSGSAVVTHVGWRDSARPNRMPDWRHRTRLR